MIGRVDEVVVDCQNPAALAEFWSSILGGEPVHRNGAWSVSDPTGWTRLAFQRVPETKQGKNRLHIDVHVDDVPGRLLRLKPSALSGSARSRQILRARSRCSWIRKVTSGALCDQPLKVNRGLRGLRGRRLFGDLRLVVTRTADDDAG